MTEVLINNCPRKIKFTPEVVYPEKYFTLGKCSPLEKAIGSDQLVKIQINGNEENIMANMPAECLSDCPLE